MSASRDWHQILRDLSERNDSVELTPVPATEDDNQSPPPGACRARVLAVESDGTVVVELPPTPAEAQPLRDAKSLDVLAAEAGQRWTARCPMLGTTSHRLNERRSVLALRLGEPGQVDSAQRRRYYRVDTVGVATKPVTLTLVVPTKDDATFTIEARLLNLSAGGMGLRLEKLGPETRRVLTGRAYECRIELPEHDEPIAVRAQLVHAEPTHNRAIYLGLEFQFDDRMQQRRIQDQITRFATERQRKQLQRKRGA